MERVRQLAVSDMDEAHQWLEQQEYGGSNLYLQEMVSRRRRVMIRVLRTHQTVMIVHFGDDCSFSGAEIAFCSTDCRKIVVWNAEREKNQPEKMRHGYVKQEFCAVVL